MCFGEHADSDDGTPGKSLSHGVSGEAGSAARRMKSSSFGDYEGAAPSGDEVSQRPWMFWAELPSWCARYSCWMELSLHTAGPLRGAGPAGAGHPGGGSWPLVTPGFSSVCIAAGNGDISPLGLLSCLHRPSCNKTPFAEGPHRSLGFSPNRRRVESHKDSSVLSVDRTRVKK